MRRAAKSSLWATTSNTSPRSLDNGTPGTTGAIADGVAKYDNYRRLRIMSGLADLRSRMVDIQLRGRGIRDPRVLSAMREVPRENFVEPGLQEFAYEDGPLPIANDQTISQPYIVAFMTEAAELKPSDSMLEVGTGSGYGAAVASRVVETVQTIERHAALAAIAAKRLAGLGYTNVTVRTGDGTRGLPDLAPFDAILVAAGGPFVPEALKSQLAIGGRLIIPIGDDEKINRC